MVADNVDARLGLRPTAYVSDYHVTHEYVYTYVRMESAFCSAGNLARYVGRFLLRRTVSSPTLLQTPSRLPAVKRNLLVSLS
jgi:hypothetical protein